MAHTDLLGGKPALPTTPIPGLLLLSPPPSAIHIRRFRRPPSDPIPSPSSAEGVLHRARDDPLEKAWRALNSSGAAAAGIKGLLTGGGGVCAVICPGDVAADGDGEGSRRRQRELWCFSGGGGDWAEAQSHFEGIEEILPPIDPIVVASLLTCPEHGHSLACLDASTRPSPSTRPPAPCPVRWAPGDQAGVWRKLEWAVAEAVMWREKGRRVMLGWGGASLRSTLRPLADGRLVLRLYNAVEDSQSSTGNKPRPSRLRPLDLHACFVGAFSPTPEQEAHLSSLFDTFLGSTWRDGQSERRLEAQLSRQAAGDWAIFWIPTDQDQELDGLGVLTVWPLHLVDGSTRLRNQYRRRRHSGRRLIPDTTPSDAMSTASALFDFMTTYQEPVLPADTPTEIDDIAPEETEEDPIFQDMSDAAPLHHEDNAGEREGGDDSDAMDDLFSAHSPTPPLPPFAEEAQSTEVAEPTDGASVKSTLLVPSVPGRNGAIRSRHTTAEPDARNMITEDDFAFFDPPQDEEEEGSEPRRRRDKDERVDDPSSMKVDEEKIDVEVDLTELRGSNEEAADAPSQVDGAPEADESVLGYEVPNGSHTEKPATPPRAIHPENTTGQGPASDGPPDPPVPKKDDLVPSPFASVELPSEKSKARPHSATMFAYTLPSPAPTPDTNPLDPLKSPPGAAAYDYASTWEVDSEASSSVSGKAADRYTGAPPTPRSEIDDEMTPSEHGETDARPVDGSRAGKAEVEFQGVTCVGAEWVALAGDEQSLETLKVKWEATWGSGVMPSEVAGQAYPSPATSPRDSKTPSDKIEYDRFAEEVLANRHVRRLFHSFEETAWPVADNDQVTGVLLSELSNESNTALKQPCIHAGLGGNVASLSIAGLSYWRELGLQPVGGRKDVTAWVVCENVDPIKRDARDFLQRMGEVYQANQLGKHSTAEASTDGIIASPRDGMISSVKKLLAKASENTIIYVLFPSSSLALSLLSDVSPAPTKVLHLLPPDILSRPRDYPRIAFDVYDRLVRPVTPTDPRLATSTCLQYPFFTLAPEKPPKIELSLQWPVRSYDVLNRWRFVHVGYGVDERRGKVVAMVCDEAGEGWEVRCFDLKGRSRARGNGEDVEIAKGDGAVGRRVVRDMWDWARVWGEKRVGVEVRTAVCRLGNMGDGESDAWLAVFAQHTRQPMTVLTTPLPTRAPASQAFVPPRPAAPIPPSTFADPTTRILDDTLVAHAVSFPHRISPAYFADEEPRDGDGVLPSSTFLVSLACSSDPASHTTAPFHILHHRAAAGRDEPVGDELAREYYRLACLGRMRWDLAGGLPAHLEGVRMILGCLEGLSL